VYGDGWLSLATITISRGYCK